MPFVASRILETFLSAKNTYSILLNVCLEGLTLSIQGLVHNNTYTCRSIVWGFYLEFEFVNEILRCELSNANTGSIVSWYFNFLNPPAFYEAGIEFLLNCDYSNF